MTNTDIYLEMMRDFDYAIMVSGGVILLAFIAIGIFEILYYWRDK
jgi:hypothetical protein